ncbi:alpha/beta fold hydrolase [Streptococcus caprae]|uniref:Alpha/beta fold hydrolase n=1 Tax=Streptococcus caprae TaxID=1640501 RepID=A0ABV8CTT1_9STRE
MTDIILIHGTWCTGAVWGQFATDLENLGFRVHTPTLRYHDLPYDECATKVGTVGLTDYVDDLVALIESMEQPPLLLGHSLGCLIGQLAAARTQVAGMILMGPAPTAGIFAFYPTMLRCFGKHLFEWKFWNKPMLPHKYKDEFFRFCMNVQDEADKEVVFADLVPESGRTYTEMAFPFLDKKRSAYVDFSKITGPVLVITGTEDKMVVPAIARSTAKNYTDAVLVSITGADHMYESGKFRQTTVDIIDSWLSKKGFK